MRVEGTDAAGSIKKPKNKIVLNGETVRTRPKIVRRPAPTPEEARESIRKRKYESVLSDSPNPTTPTLNTQNYTSKPKNKSKPKQAKLKGKAVKTTGKITKKGDAKATLTAAFQQDKKKKKKKG